MKNGRLFIFVTCIILLVPIIAFSHPGSLDANGGHWDRKNGVYHFHEGKNTSGNSNSFYHEYEPFTPPYTPPTENPYKKNKYSEKTPDSNEKKDIVSVILSILFLAPFAISIACTVGEFLWDCTIKPLFYFKRNSIKKLIDTAYDTIRREKKCVSEINRAVKYINTPPIVDTPPCIEILDNKLIVKNINNSVVTLSKGKKLRTPFVYYISSKGQCYHTKKGCSNATKRLNAIENIIQINKMTPCKKCASNIDMDVIISFLKCYTSFVEYQKYERNKVEYRSLIDESKQKLICLSQTKSKLIQRLIIKEKYIKKHKELAEKYNMLLKYMKSED